MIRVVRLMRERFAPTALDAFSGLGAQMYGGRWNSPGLLACYAASVASLAILETLVHIDRKYAPTDYRLAFAILPDTKIATIAALPPGWRTSSGIAATRALGDAFLRDHDALALAIPSVVVPSELNYLLNPHHPDWHQLYINPAMEPFAFDARLFLA